MAIMEPISTSAWGTEPTSTSMCRQAINLLEPFNHLGPVTRKYFQMKLSNSTLPHLARRYPATGAVMGKPSRPGQDCGLHHGETSTAEELVFSVERPANRYGYLKPSFIFDY